MCSRMTWLIGEIGLGLQACCSLPRAVEEPSAVPTSSAAGHIHVHQEPPTTPSLDLEAQVASLTPQDPLPSVPTSAAARRRESRSAPIPEGVCVGVGGSAPAA